jgi:hypothetical protein
VFPVSSEFQELLPNLGIVLIHVCFMQTEKQPPWNSMDDGIPCGIYCYKLVCILRFMTSENQAVLCDNLDAET